MAKIFIEVDSLANGKSYEFSVDNTMKVQTAKEKIIEQIIDIEKNNISFNLENVILCNSSREKILNSNASLYQENVVSGSRLLIV